MAVYFLSDLHLLGSHRKNDPFYSHTLTFLSQNVKQGDTVVLGGDIFDVFVGNKSIFKLVFRDFFTLMEQLTTHGASIRYVMGNHDFQHAASFSGLSNFLIHDDLISFQTEGKCFTVAHGDLIDPCDWTYKLLRKFFRSNAMSALLLIVPGSLLYWVGRHWSRYSRDIQASLPTDFSSQKLDRIRDSFRHFAETEINKGAQFVILGHSHDADHVKFEKGEYWNMGFPRLTGEILKWTAETGMQKIRI